MKEWNLLRGSMKPSDQEKAQGILDDINEGDKNQSLSIQEKKLKISQEILQNTGQLIISNAQLLGLNEEQAQALSSALQLGDAAAKAASGDIIGAATEAAGAIMSMLSGIITKSSEFEETMDRINHLIELQNYQWEREKALIDSLVGKESINESAKAIAKNKQDLADLQAIMNKGVTLGGMKGMKDAAAVFAKGDIEKYRDAYEQVLKMQQKGYDFNNKQVDGLKKIIDDYDAIVQRGKDLSIQMEQTLTGTNFSDLTDQMTEMFNSGKDSAVDFADTLESNLKRALTNAFKQQFLMAQLDKLNKDLAIAMGDKDGLTNSEIKSYSEGYKQIFDKAKTEWEKMKESFPDIFSPAVDSVKNASSLSGAIKGASEESINMLSGYANAIRLNQIDSINIMRNQLMYASETAVNTRYLKSIEAGISALVNSDSLRSKGL
jgi:tetratricopeptide (TPR) repeat protein